MARSRGGRAAPPAHAATPPPPSLAALALIRIALLFGVLAFGAATTYIVRRGDWMPGTRDLLATLRPIGIALAVVAVLGVVVLRVSGTRIAGRMGAATPSILGWALGEMVAVFGGVYYFVSGDHTWYLIGVTFLVATFVVFPIRRAGT